MKKKAIIAVLAFVLIIPQVAYSEETPGQKLLSALDEFDKCGEELSYISADLFGSKPLTDVLGIVMAHINNAKDLIGYHYRFVSALGLVKETHKLIYVRTAISYSEETKERLDSLLALIQYFYSGIENPAQLHLIDRAKDKLRSSIKSLEEVIEILKTIENTYLE